MMRYHDVKLKIIYDAKIFVFQLIIIVYPGKNCPNNVNRA